jgi:type IV pilus assembly protein PilN
MAQINLLPWREQLREERKKRFLTILAIVLVAGIGIILLAAQYYSGAISAQTARDDYLKKEIAVLDARITQISELQNRRKQLIARMKTIQDLQGNRPIIGRVFDQLARTLPDGVYFTEVKMGGQTIAITGSAESNNKVSELMRNLDGSPWLGSAALTEVKAKAAGDPDQNNVFQLTVQQIHPATEGDNIK